MFWLLGIWLRNDEFECGPTSPANYGVEDRYASLAACRHVRATLRREHADLKVNCRKTREEEDLRPEGGARTAPRAPP